MDVFSGTFLYPPIELPNGEVAHIAGVYEGVAQWYGNVETGKFYAAGQEMPVDPYAYWGAQTEKSWLERAETMNVCPYCGGSGTHTNLRGGEECAGCSAPRQL